MKGDLTLFTDRLTLRPTVIADAEGLFAAYGDDEVMRFWDIPRVRNIEDMTEMLSWSLGPGKNDTALMWSVCSAETRSILGMVSYHHLERWHHRADISFLLARQHWGKGFASEALTALIQYCFGQMLLHRLVALVDLQNENSRKTVERLGFKKEGELREHICVAGRYHTVMLYGLLAASVSEEYAVRNCSPA